MSDEERERTRNIVRNDANCWGMVALDEEEYTDLQSRITTLTAELDAWKATTWQTPEQAMGCIASWKAEEESWAEEAARLREELEKANSRLTMPDGSSRIAALAKELATERAAREEDAKDYARSRKELYQQAVQAERERDTALGLAESHRAEACTALERETKTLDALNRALPFVDRALTAESALASARVLLTRWITWLKGKDNRRALIADSRAWLSSAPSPAPCSGCAKVREEVKKWTLFGVANDCRRIILKLIGE